MPRPARPGGSDVVRGLHHFTLRCSGSELGPLRDFYCDVLGLKEGPRPDFDFPGSWLYAGDEALLHLAAILPESSGRTDEQHTSGFDHVSLRGTDLDATRKRLRDLGTRFEELPVPGWPLWQIFLHDPAGSKIELTFERPQA